MINYNLANEYIEKLIKLGITPDNVKTAYDNYNKSYIHYLTGEYYSAGDPRVYCVITFTNNKNIAMDFNYVVNLLISLGCTSTSKLYPATGYSAGNSMASIDPFTIVGVYADITYKRLVFVSNTTRTCVIRSLTTDKIIEI